MPRRTLLSPEPRERLFGFAIDQAEMAKHYIFTAGDMNRIRSKRRPGNRLGFAVQLCALRFPGQALAPSELPPAHVLAFVAAQQRAPARGSRDGRLKAPLGLPLAA